MKKTVESAYPLKKLDYTRHVISMMAKEWKCKIDYLGDIHLPFVESIENFSKIKTNRDH